MILPVVAQAALPLRPVPAPVLVALRQALRGEVTSGFDFFSKAGMVTNIQEGECETSTRLYCLYWFTISRGGWMK